MPAMAPRPVILDQYREEQDGPKGGAKAGPGVGQQVQHLRRCLAIS